jgi:hypothetical protein
MQHAAVETLRRSQERTVMAGYDFEEMGPVDYVVLEWPHQQPRGQVVPMILELVDRGVIRILDIAFAAKDVNGEVTGLEMDALEGEAAQFREFHGASSGLLDAQDLREAAEALEPGTSAAILVWENRWAAPIAVALRESGGQLVANGRIPIQAILASLEADAVS